MKIQDLVGRKLSKSNRMLVKEAFNRGVEFEILPKKRFRMKYGKKSYLVKRGKISHAFNTKLAAKVTKYKDVTNRLLRNEGFPAPENFVFTSNELDRAWNWCNRQVK